MSLLVLFLRIELTDSIAHSGYILMGQRMEEKPSNDMCLMFIDGIRLIRFHNKLPEETEASKTDTVKAEKPDSLKPHVRRLGERPVLRTVEKERN